MGSEVSDRAVNVARRRESTTAGDWIAGSFPLAWLSHVVRIATAMRRESLDRIRVRCFGDEKSRVQK